ncbi:MAG: WG repeat-containing protein, partial [Bacteroidota bacterium]|nr:WG repeat-containing protein [Bacteroidota bacterium]
MRITKLLSLKSVIFPALFILLILSSCGNGKFRAAVKEKGKYGYIDESGDYVISPQFDVAWSFIRGSAVVKEKGLYGLIDKDGKYIVEPTYDSIIPFSSSCLIVQKDSVFGFISTGDGKMIIKPQFENVFGYTNELCLVQKGKSLGIVNEKAKIVCPVTMQRFTDMYSAGAICIQGDTTDDLALLLLSIQNGVGVKKGILNAKGEVIVNPKYNDIFDDAANGFYYPFMNSPDAPETSFFQEENEFVAGTYGVIDTGGKIISEPVFEEMPVYGDKMFRIKKGGKYGYMDLSGTIVIQPVYEYAVAFSEGKAIVASGNPLNPTASIIDKTGKVLVEDLGPGSGMYRFFNGLARCRSLNGKYGFLDTTGTRVIAPTLD